MTTLTARQIFRAYETDGVPASGAHKPVKEQIVEYLQDRVETGALGQVVADRAAMKAIPGGSTIAVMLAEGGRSGPFIWMDGDFSAQVAADPLEGIFVKVTDTLASVGVFMRAFDGKAADVAWFGAKPDFTGTDDAVGINGAIAAAVNLSFSRVVASGRFKLQTKIDFTPWGTTNDPAQLRKVFDGEAGHFYQNSNLVTAIDLCPSDGSVLVKKTIKVGSLYGIKASYTSTRAVYLRHVANCSISIGLIENWAGKGFEVDQTGTPAWGGFANNIDIDKISNNTGDGFYAAAATSGVVGFEGNTVRITHSIGNGGRAYVIGAAANQRVEGNNFRIGAADGNTGSALYFGGKGNVISFGALYSNGSPDIDCAAGIIERNRITGWVPAALVVSSTVTREHGINGYPEYLNSGSAATTAVTTEETLMSYSIPANTLKPGMRVKLRAWGTTAANGNNKVIKLKFGGAGGFIAAVNSALNAVPWEVEGEVLILASNSQEYHSVFHINALGPLIRQGTSTETDTGAIVCSLTGQNGTASAGDITVQGFRVEIVG